MARKYNKSNLEYWNSRKEGYSSGMNEFEKAQLSLLKERIPDYDIWDMGEDSKASSESSGRGSITSRRNKAATSVTTDRYKLIADGLTPYNYSVDGVDMKNVYELCQKAYWNFSVVRGTIDLQTDFTDSEVYLEGGNNSSKEFIKAWFDKIKLNNLKQEFFGEFFLSCAVFPYRLEGYATNPDDLFASYNAKVKGKKIPLGYLVLNPVDIVSRGGFVGEDSYCKILTSLEVARFNKNPTPKEKEFVNSLPKETRDEIKQSANGTTTQVELPLDSSRLRPCFYKKKAYEPFAVPVIFPVLADLNRKEEMKNIDQAIARQGERMILLVTQGAKPTEGGINAKNLGALQTLLANKSVHQTIVADYTTKGAWLIPDLTTVLFPQKYEVINQDIEHGLQNVLLGESKYADTKLKLKMFMERLNQARQCFLDNFLQPEIDNLCKIAGFKQTPKACFKKSSVFDDADIQRLVTRMMELGILTPEQGIKVIDTGVFPSGEELGAAQDDYVKKKQAGHFVPMANTNQMVTEEIIPQNAPPPIPVGKTAPKKAGVKKTGSTSGPSGGRPLGNGGTKKSKASLEGIKGVILKIEDLYQIGEEKFKQQFGLKRLNKEQKEGISNACEIIIKSKELDSWTAAISDVAGDFNLLEKFSVSEGVTEMSEYHDLPEYEAALLYHSSKLGGEE